jgi:hypothetical protein
MRNAERGPSQSPKVEGRELREKSRGPRVRPMSDAPLGLHLLF